MPFTRSSIEEVGRKVNLLLGYGAEVSVFGEELPEQAVEVLVASTFPGMVRTREVHQQLGALLKFFVVRHLTSVVERQAPLQVAWQWRKQLFNAQPNCSFVALGICPTRA